MSDLLVFKRSCRLIGNHFELSVIADDEKWANERMPKGLNMINQIKNTEAIIIDDDDKMYTSKNINIKQPLI
jgi:thiamine biosynthesis lipoprotein